MSILDKIKNGELSSFKGGITPDEHKDLTSNLHTQSLPQPSELVIPLRQHSGSAAEVLVKPGDHVLVGTALTKPESKMQVPVHAPLAGTITALEMRPAPHASGRNEPCLILKVDAEQPQESASNPSFPEYTKEDPTVLLKHIKDMGIAGLGGAGFPTDVKLSSNVGSDHPKCQVLIINGAECEPYITCDDRIMQEQPTQIIKGAAILKHILKPDYTVFAIEDNKPQAIKAISEAIKAEGLTDARVTVLPVKYPSGAARNLIKLITGIEVPYTARSADYGFIVQNVSTVKAVFDAVVCGIPLTERLITVTGNAIARPGNYFVKTGTSVSFILHQVGYQKPTVPRIILGGPMMGFTIHTSQVPVIKTTSCIIAPGNGELVRTVPQVQCIRCGRCAHACPSRLVPYELYSSCVTGNMKEALKNGLKSCIECGCCSFVCPSAVRLTEEFRVAKATLRTEKAQERKLKVCRERYQAKQIRLQEEEKLRAERRAQALAKAKAMQEAKAKAQAQAKAQAKAQAQAAQVAPTKANENITKVEAVAPTKAPSVNRVAPSQDTPKAPSQKAPKVPNQEAPNAPTSVAQTMVKPNPVKEDKN